MERYHFICNGYSNDRKESVKAEEIGNITITFAVVPYTYESVYSGICSAYSAGEHAGFLLAAGKGGQVEVRLGTGRMTAVLKSKCRQLDYQKPNVITVAFWGDAGWCDLSINGELSNRIQLPRHSALKFTASSGFLGKYVDGAAYTEETKRGIFHGEITFVEAKREYLPYAVVGAWQKEYLSTVDEPVIDLYEAEKYIEDAYRPVYHLMPTGKWMNEPHAPFFYEGYYHIFYQANPHAPVWDNLCWGHLISTDLINWKDAGIALNPDVAGDENLLAHQDYDRDGCWSGSACMDENGIPLLFYTAGDNRQLPNQSVAMARPMDEKEKQLKEWKKLGVVLKQSLTDGFLGEFRDPFVWRKDNTYYMLVGTGDSANGGGNALVYTSTDLKEYTCHGFLMEYDYERCTEGGHVWELPVLLPLNNEAGEYVCDVLLFCACQIEHAVVETYYFLGKFDYETKKFVKSHELPRLLDLGNGTFTGPSGFVTPDKRSVVFTIAQGKREHLDEYNSGWAHNGGLPVALSIRENELGIAPVEEIKKYFPKKLLVVHDLKQKEVAEQLAALPILENRIRLSTAGLSLGFTLDFGADAIRISYDRSSRCFAAEYEKSGERISKCRSDEDLVEIGAEDIELECYVDHSMIEVYLNSRKSITLRNYKYQGAYQLRIAAAEDYQLEVWEFDFY